MKQQNKIKGNIGEDAAGEFLIHKGYVVIERNVYTRFGELDIIATHKNTLVFIEVKTKTGHVFGEPWEMVSKGKLYQVRKMAEQYLIHTGHAIYRTRCRIDVIGVWLNYQREVERIEHWENLY